VPYFCNSKFTGYNQNYERLHRYIIYTYNWYKRAGEVGIGRRARNVEERLQGEGRRDEKERRLKK